MSARMNAIKNKIDHIYDDLAYNVTHIYERQNLHLAIDLVYHSPLAFRFEGALRKGYPEALIVGDTRCGKTETAEKLVRHYRLGAIASGETCTFAGLIGSCQQIRSKWQVVWGRVPFNNKRLLIIDEVSGLSVNEIENMSSVRSSGIAEINKVKTAKCESRTRMIWLSNPRKGLNIKSQSSAVYIVRELIGKAEDIARFDFIIAVSADDVDPDLINFADEKEVPHTYDSESCKNLILWSWTRTPDHIVISKETASACRSLAKEMYTKYSDNFPIVNSREQKLKLARLSTALACRLFNTDDGERVIVEPEHVEYIYQFLVNEYDKPSFGYDNWSQNQKRIMHIKDKDSVLKIVSEMGDHGASVLLDTRQISVKMISETMAYSDEEARSVVSNLIKYGALYPYHTYYFKTQGFVEILKEYVNSPKQEEKEEF